MHLILIDEKLQGAIQKLNDAHLWTVDCCEGHFDDAFPNMYISFVNNIRFSDAPEKFKLENHGTIIRYMYKNTKSKKEFEKEKEEILKNLYKWVDEKIKNR